jgi:hypothetical protein
MDKKTGGPAFPSLKESHQDQGGAIVHVAENGLTVRDYFAIRLIQAAISAGNTCNSDGAQSERSSWGYRFADAMLAARAQ